ncbi:hypothetical protein BC835DRAFT_1522462 [Cytidiella melzeri]|nr:hypothetical protein BC835DRAFT_1522462 [Cytidiella melzeri]
MSGLQTPVLDHAHRIKARRKASWTSTKLQQHSSVDLQAPTTFNYGLPHQCTSSRSCAVSLCADQDLFHLQSADKKRCLAALDVLETKYLSFDWSPNWASVHDGNTSQLKGLKPGCRQDSTGDYLYWVGLFNAGSNKRVQPPPLVQASFRFAPITAEVVAALRAKLA